MTRRHHVVVLLLAPVVGYDAVIPPQLFGTAVDDAGDPLYDVTVAGLTTAAVPTEHGYAIVPTADASAVRTADTLVVPGTLLPAARTDGVLPPDVRAVFGTIPRRTRILSICTGAFVLAAAGLLDGRPATTHWQRAAAFRALYPDVRLEENRLFTDDGDVLTSAGLSAGVDLCLHVIRRDHGVAVANRVARHCVVPPWRDGGQAQFIERPVPVAGADSTAPAREWALAHLGETIDVARLAAEVRMSLRTFNRRFRDETGEAPGAWLAARRVDHARHLLERTDLGIDEVARRAGLGSGANLRQRMRAVVGRSPAGYRRTFRALPAGPAGPAGPAAPADRAAQPSASVPKVSQRSGSPER